MGALGYVEVVEALSIVNVWEGGGNLPSHRYLGVLGPLSVPQTLGFQFRVQC